MSCQGSAPAQASHGVATSFGHPPTPGWVPPHSMGGSLLPHGPSRAARAQLLHHGLNHGLQGKLCSVPGVPPPSPSALTLVSAGHDTFSLPLTWLLGSAAAFSPVLNTLSQSCYHCIDGLSLCQWSQLIMALLDLGEASGSFSMNSLCSPPPWPLLPKPCHTNCLFCRKNPNSGHFQRLGYQVSSSLLFLSFPVLLQSLFMSSSHLANLCGLSLPFFTSCMTLSPFPC